MEPITTTTMIGAVVGYLAKTLKDNKSIHDFFSDFTDATVGWIRPLFLTDEQKPDKIITDLVKNPDSPAKKGMVEMAIASHLEDNPDAAAQLRAMYEAVRQKAGKTEGIHIAHSKNVIVGNVQAGGNFVVGDNNNTNNPK